MTDTCATCSFFRTGDPNGECRRYPPSVFPVFLEPQAPARPGPSAVIPGVGRIEPQQQPRPQKIAGFGSNFAPTQPGNWCGEHRARES